MLSEMKRKKTRKSTLSENLRDDPVVAESRRIMEKEGFCDEECEVFADKAIEILNDCRECFGDGYEFEYLVRRHYGRVELRIILAGERFNPFENGNGAEERSQDKSLYRLLRDRTSTVYYSYVAGRNIIMIYSPTIRQREFAIKSPILWVLILGLLSGMICKNLPEAVCHFLTEELATPLFSVTIGAMTGIMGPMIFLSMVISISSLESINKLTDLGGKILGRFIRSTLLAMGISIAVSL